MSSQPDLTYMPTWKLALLLLGGLSACSPSASAALPMRCGTTENNSATRSDGRTACGAAARSGSDAQSTPAATSNSSGAPSTGAPPNDSAANGCKSTRDAGCTPATASGASTQSGNMATAAAGMNASAAGHDSSAGSHASSMVTPSINDASSAGSHATAGAAGTAAADGCSAQNLIFCDDFETRAASGMPPAAPWTIANNGMGHALIDTQTPAHSGKASVKVTSEGGYQTFFALTGAPAFPHDGALYLRVYIRLEAAMTSGHNTYYKAGASGNPSSDHETRMGVMNGMLMINQPASDRGFLSNEEYYRDGNKPGVVFAPMTWVCVETFFDPANKSIDVWVDGNEVKDLHRTDWEQDPIGALHFGFEKYAGPDATLWYDDIALSTQAIGCR